MSNVIAALVTLQHTPFEDGPQPDDLVIRIVDFNEQGLEIIVLREGVEATPNEYGLAQYMVSRLGYTNTALTPGQVIYIRPSLLAGTAIGF